METPIQETPNVSQNFQQKISSLVNSKTVGILALLFLFAAIPLTVFIAQQQQEVRQRASGMPNEDNKDDSTINPCKKNKNRPGGCECTKDQECSSTQCNRAEGQKEGKCAGPTPTPTIPETTNCESKQGRPSGCECKSDKQCKSDVCDQPATRSAERRGAKICQGNPEYCDVGNNKPGGCRCRNNNQCTSDECRETSGGDKACTGPTPTPTDTTEPPGTQSAKLAIKLSLQGIGSDGNPSPLREQRDITVTLIGEQNNEVEKTGQMTFSSASGSFTTTLDMGTVPPGPYSIKAKTKGYLRKLVAKILNIKSGTSNYVISQTPVLVPGDINGDNKIDITDYNLLISCFGDKAQTQECEDKTLSDLNDDGSIDGVDYNLFLRALAVREGD